MTNMKNTASWELLARLKQHGIRWLFCNSGTDFAPIIETYEAATDDEREQFPELLTISHETVAIGMAHGAYIVSGHPQAIMVHVHVGLANALMGIINCQSDQSPILVLAGKTPITEFQKHGGRMTPQQSGQDVFDQNGIARQFVKWDSELRDPEQIIDLIDRALGIAQQSPKGPVLLSLPREPLAGNVGAVRTSQLSIPSPPKPPIARQSEIDEVKRLLTQADRPLLIIQKNDHECALAEALNSLASNQGIAVIEPFTTRNAADSQKPYHLGYQSGGLVEAADLILVVESQSPWIQRFESPNAKAIIHIGQDPFWTNLPSKSHRMTLSIAGDAADTLDRLNSSVTVVNLLIQKRWEWIQKEKSKRAATLSNLKEQMEASSEITPAMVGQAMAEHMTETTRVFSELGPPPASASPRYPNQWFTPPFSGGLGWGVPCALGAKLAAPKLQIIACIGDGSFLFANPLACIHTAINLKLSILIIVMNNGAWNATRRAAHNMYPNGQAMQNTSPILTSLDDQLDFAEISKASGIAAYTVKKPTDLKPCFNKALNALLKGDRPVLINIITSKTDGF